MTDINLKTLTPDTSLPTTGFLFGADSQASTNPSVYSTQTVATTLLGSTSLTGGPALTADAPVLNLTQTWDNNAVTFTGIKYNVTNTNSAAASLLMDLQVGTTSLFSVGKAGNVKAPTGSAAAPSYAMDTTGMYSRATFARVNFSVGGTDTGVEIGPVTLALQNTASLVWTAGTLPSSSPDTYITRKAAANLRFGAADAASPVAQTLSVQSIVGGLTGTPNLSAAAYPFTITGAQGTGTGAGGSIVFQVAPAGSSGPAQNALADALTIASTKLVTLTGDLGLYSSNTLRIGGSSVNWQITATTTGIIQGSANYYGFFDGTNLAAGGSVDTRLYRDAAGVLGVRGTSTSVGAALSFIEQTAPASPAANIVRIYAEDNGSGKTRLMAIFATGAAQQIAIEP